MTYEGNLRLLILLTQSIDMLYVGENANNPAANALKPNLTIFRIVKKVKRNILAC